jgi:Ca2+-binding EF-hand superfamily protein
MGVQDALAALPPSASRSRAAEALKQAHLQRSKGVRRPRSSEQHQGVPRAARFGPETPRGLSPRDVRTSARSQVSVSTPKSTHYSHKFKVRDAQTLKMPKREQEKLLKEAPKFGIRSTGPSAHVRYSEKFKPRGEGDDTDKKITPEELLQRGTGLPRDFLHIRAKTPPKRVKAKTPPPSTDQFGPGDIVRLVNPAHPEALAYGAAKNWATTGVGKVMVGGRRHNGDCLIEVGGQRLWVKQNEIDMVVQSTEPRPSTAEEIRRENRRRARERKARQKARRERAAKWSEVTGGGGEEEMQMEEVRELFDEIDEDGGGSLDKDELRELLEKLGLEVTDEKVDSVMLEMDADGEGAVELQEFLWWWKKAGKEYREKMTKLKDEMNDVKNLFDEFDDDGSGEIGEEELRALIQMLGVTFNEDELKATMLELDKDGSGEVDFQEFYKWWRDPATEGRLAACKERMSSVKDRFDEVDIDHSGSLDREEVRQLCEKMLEVELSEQQLDQGMAEMDGDGGGEVDFNEFYIWWDRCNEGLLGEAKLRAERKAAQWKAVKPIESNYSGAKPESKAKALDASARRYTGGKAGGAAAPRLRRCTVDQIFSMMGSARGENGGGEGEDEVSEEVQQLIEAAETGDEALVQQLIDQGVATNQGMLGVTPLMVAAANGHASVCALLLSNGAEVNAHDEDGLSALDWAEDLDGEEGDVVRKALVDAGGEPGPGEEEDDFDDEDFEGGEADTRGMVGAGAGEFFTGGETEPKKEQPGERARHEDGRLVYSDHELDFDMNEDRRKQQEVEAGMKAMLDEQVQLGIEKVQAAKSSTEHKKAEEEAKRKKQEVEDAEKEKSWKKQNAEMMLNKESKKVAILGKGDAALPLAARR